MSDRAKPSSERSGDDQRRDGEWPIPRLFLEYGGEYRNLVALALATSAIAPLASLVPPYLLQATIDAVLLNHTRLSFPVVPQAWLPGDRLGQLYLLAGGMVVAAGVAAAADWLGQRTWGLFAQHIQHDVRTDSYDRIQDFEMGYFDEQQTGELLSILNNDVNQLEEFLTDFLGSVVQISVMLVGVSVVMITLHWQLSLVALLVIPLMAVLSRFFVVRIRPTYETVRGRVGALSARIDNNLDGIRVTKVYAAEPREAERVEAASRRLFDARWEAITTRVKFFPAMSFLNWVAFGVLIVLGGIWIVDGPPLLFTKPLSVGVLVAFLVYNQQFTNPLMQVGSLVDQYYDARASVVRIFSLHDRTVAAGTDAEPVGPLDGRVSFEDVSFSYPGEEEQALESVSFEVESGSFVGVVGPTGSGKTTLTKLLLRFHDPDEGTVRIDGRDLTSVERRDLRAGISAVSQEPYLFSGTIRENVGYGVADATDDEIERAARMANVHEFVTDLPDGYDTSVGQRGAKFSGGQCQRIAIARAVANDPELLVLDEATSHVDNETEALIQHALSELVEDRTTFAIAHRLSTVRHADTILVLDSGRIVERGTHEELLDRDGLYADLWRVQVGEVTELPDRFLDRYAEQPSAGRQ